MLTEAMNEVKSTVEAETYDIDPDDILVSQLMFPPLKIELKVQELESRMLKYDDVIHVMGKLSLDFSKITLAEVYTMQHVSVMEIRIKENSLAHQGQKHTRKEKEHKVLLRHK